MHFERLSAFFSFVLSVKERPSLSGQGTMETNQSKYIIRKKIHRYITLRPNYGRRPWLTMGHLRSPAARATLIHPSIHLSAGHLLPFPSYFFTIKRNEGRANSSSRKKVFIRSILFPLSYLNGSCMHACNDDDTLTRNLC